MKLSFPKSLVAAAAVLGLALGATQALAASNHKEPEAPEGGWTFDGPFGTFDQAQLQRGFKVYKEVCASCHSMNLVHYRDLGDKGGPFYDPKFKPTENPYVKALAADAQIDDIDTTTGDPIKRKGIPADHFPAPYANATAAAASNGGAVPPDQSTLAKAREGGASYIYSLLTGYQAPPPGLKMNPGQNYNPYMTGDMSSYWTGKGPPPPGGFIAMPPPLADDKVTYDDKTKATLKQEAQDVAAFLEWASDPHATERKQMGVAVMIYLLLFAGVMYLSYRRVWKNVAH